MSGLLNPLPGHPISQAFGTPPNVSSLEPAGWLQDSGGRPLRFRTRLFLGSGFRRHVHPAIDIVAPTGTPVLAAERSIVVAAGTYHETGEHYLMLQIKPGTVLFYTHLKANSLIHAVGSHVQRGARVALSGNSGLSSGPHLHFEVRIGQGDPRLSSRWFRWNPRRLFEGGDHADLPAIKP